MRPRIFLLALLLAGPVFAQAPSELTSIQNDFEFGKFRAVHERAEARIDQGSLEEAELISLHKYAGLAAFNLNLKDSAQRHFEALLKLDPDFSLDPFAVPPPAIAFLEQLRAKLGKELERLRQEHQYRLDRTRREQELRLERERVNELGRRSLEDLARRAAETTAPRSMVVNFIPFGAGQFQEGRMGAGVGFAVGEGLLAALSIASFWIYDSMLVTEDVILDPDQPSGTVHIRGIRPQDQSRALLLTRLKYIGGVGFLTLYAGGVLDALLHFPPPRSPLGPSTPRANVILLPGGAGLALTQQF